MGLFINNVNHPEVYKNKDKIQEPNQQYSRRDYLSDLMEEQRRANKQLLRSLTELQSQYYQHEEIQMHQWNEVGNQLHALKTSNLEHKEIETIMNQQIRAIDEKNLSLQATLEKEGLLKENIVAQINLLSDSNQEIASRLDKNELANDQLSEQMKEQVELQKQLVDHFSKQEDFQQGVLGRLDKQEALTEKISRQLNHVRSILFERTNYLATKIEDGYKLTSSYVYQLMTGSDQPLSFYLINNRQEERQEQKE